MTDDDGPTLPMTGDGWGAESSIFGSEAGESDVFSAAVSFKKSMDESTDDQVD